MTRARLRVGRAPRVAGRAIEDLAWGFLAPPRRAADVPRRRASRSADAHARTAQAPNLFARRREAAEPLAVTLARLRARLGDDALGRAELRPAVRPESAWRRVRLGRRDPHASSGWDAADPPVDADPVDLLPLPGGRTLRLMRGGARAIAAPDPASLRAGPCTLSGEWWADGFDRDYYLRVGDAMELVFLDRGRGRWFVQGEVD